MIYIHNCGQEDTLLDHTHGRIWSGHYDQYWKMAITTVLVSIFMTINMGKDMGPSDHNHVCRSLLKFEVNWICYKKVMAETKFMADFT